MQQVAENDKFRHIFPGVPSIGGRYSALSNFGMVPAAVMGLDVKKFLDRTMRSEEDVRAALGLPVLATIPVLGRGVPRRAGGGDRNSHV